VCPSPPLGVGGSFPGRMEPPTAKQPVPSAHVVADGEGTLTVLTRAAETLNGEGSVQATAVLWKHATALKEAQSQLPQGWKQLWSSQQRPYYMHKKSRVCVWERPDQSSGPPDPTCCICRKCYMARVQASGAAEPVSPSSSAGGSTQGSPAHDAVADKTGSNGRRGSELEIWQAYPELHRAPPEATGSRETRPTGLAHEPGEAANVYERQAASEHSGVDAVQTGHQNASPHQDDGTANSLAFSVFKVQQIKDCCSAPAPLRPQPMTDSGRQWAPTSVSCVSESTSSFSTSLNFQSQLDQDEIGSSSAGVHHCQTSADCVLAAQARSEAHLFGAMLPHVTTQVVEEVVHERRPEAADEQNTRRRPVNRQEDAEITKNELGARHWDDASAQGQYPYPSPSTCRQEEGLECVEVVGEDRGIEKRCRPARKHEDTGIDNGNDSWPWLRKRQESMSTPSHAVSGQQHPQGSVSGGSDQTQSATHNHDQTAPVLREWGKPLQTDNLLERLRAKWQHLTSSPERFRALGQATRENVNINIEREGGREMMPEIRSRGLREEAPMYISTRPLQFQSQEIRPGSPRNQHEEGREQAVENSSIRKPELAAGVGDSEGVLERLFIGDDHGACTSHLPEATRSPKPIIQQVTSVRVSESHAEMVAIFWKENKVNRIRWRDGEMRKECRALTCHPEQLMGVLARQQSHIQKCEMENERLRRAGCWHGNEQRETARKEEMIDLLALMHHSHELLILCATKLSEGMQPIMLRMLQLALLTR
jgi:hypothetical protein